MSLKIITRKLKFEKVSALPIPKHKNPKKPWAILRGLIRLLSAPDMIATRFSYTQSRMELVGDSPCLILMNHSAFIDLKIAYKIFFPKPLCIVATTDSYVGKPWLMPLIGCIPTQKFVSDLALLSDIRYALKEVKSNVLMFPEAGYTFDGTATALPSHFGRLIKRLNVPVVTIITEGAFLRQPLYNELRTRKTKVSAKVECILTPDEIKAKSVSELDEILNNIFSFDNFARQYETKTVIDTPDRAEGLERILYRCACCEAELSMKSEGTKIACQKCGKTYEMDIYGRLSAQNGETEFSHIPDWFRWERESVRKEIENGGYRLDTEVKIGIMKDYKALYFVGDGRLTHNENGFHLTGCDGKIDYSQGPLASHSVNADFYWYTIGDVIGIGTKEMLYYCFPKGDVSVAKVRLAAEELYKLKRKRTDKKTIT